MNSTVASPRHPAMLGPAPGLEAAVCTEHERLDGPEQLVRVPVEGHQSSPDSSTKLEPGIASASRRPHVIGSVRSPTRWSTCVGTSIAPRIPEMSVSRSSRRNPTAEFGLAACRIRREMNR